MDLVKIIQGLYAEKRNLERVIVSLEELQQSDGTLSLHRVRGKRGRKSMASGERAEVSARMKKYWASRRLAAAKAS